MDKQTAKIEKKDYYGKPLRRVTIEIRKDYNGVWCIYIQDGTNDYQNFMRWWFKNKSQCLAHKKRIEGWLSPKGKK